MGKMIKREFRITDVKLLKDTIEKINNDIKYDREQADVHKKRELMNTLILGALNKVLNEIDKEID